MLKIRTSDYKDGMTEEEAAERCRERPGHCVYLLENGRQIYIGETHDIAVRLYQHGKDPEKIRYGFRRVHVITGDAFSSSEAEHCENLLITLVRVDSDLEVINPRKGNQKNDYVRKMIFEGEFDRLWLRLREMGLVKTRDIKDVVNSKMYKYFPKAELNREQKNALEVILNTLDSGELAAPARPYKNRPLVVQGDAGTGKTVLAAALFDYLKTHEPYCRKKIGFVESHTPIREAVGQVFRDTKGLRKKDALAPADITKEHYDILICDEVHKLRRNVNLYRYAKHFKAACERLGMDTSADELDWILKQSDYQILFYDPAQRVSPSCIEPDSIKKRMLDEWGRYRPVVLRDQMRIKAGQGYVTYIRHVLRQACSGAQKFSGYDLRLFDSFPEMRREIFRKEEQYGLCRICTGYGWKWSGNDEKDAEDIILDGIPVKWNGRTKGWLYEENRRYEMGSVYSLHGLDLNYAGVVFGPELYFDDASGKIKLNGSSFFDKTLKRGRTEEEQLEFVLNIYGVLMSRGIEGTYVYVCDGGLRRYLKQFIPS